MIYNIVLIGGLSIRSVKAKVFTFCFFLISTKEVTKWLENSVNKIAGKRVSRLIELAQELVGTGLVNSLQATCSLRLCANLCFDLHSWSVIFITLWFLSVNIL